MSTQQLGLSGQAEILLQRLLFAEKLTPPELDSLHRAYAGLFPTRRPTLDSIEARLHTDGADTHMRAQLILNAWDTLHGHELETTG